MHAEKKIHTLYAWQEGKISRLDHIYIHNLHIGMYVMSYSKTYSGHETPCM